MNIYLGLIVCAVCLAPGSSCADKLGSCTAFSLASGDAIVVGKNYDWHFGAGLLIANQRGVRKQAAVDSEYFGQPVTWRSRFGSLTFNQFGREFPEGGMNEAGLVVQGLSLPATGYPEPDQRPAISSAQWIQYQLDNSASVAEVLESDRALRISPSPHYGGSHYFVCDRSATCASIEFIDGATITHSDARMPVKVLTNTPYALSLWSWMMGVQPERDPMGSLQRFMVAANRLSGPPVSGDPILVSTAFEILREVRDLGAATQWSIVYDIPARRVSFHTTENPSIRYIDLGRLDFSCGGPVKILDVNTSGAGPLNQELQSYSWEINRDLVAKALSLSFGDTVSQEELDRAAKDIARYPETMICDSPNH